MRAENMTVPFDDMPKAGQVAAVISGWRRAKLPDRWQYPLPVSERESVIELAHLVKGKLAKVQSGSQKAQLEAEVISWLYDFSGQM